MDQSESALVPDQLPSGRQGLGSQLLRVAQWVVFLFAGLILLVSLSDLEHLNVPDAPVAMIWVTIVAAGGVVALHLPKWFWRLPRLAKQGSYAALLVLLFVRGETYADTMAAYQRSPEGAREAALSATREAEAANVERQRGEAEQLMVEVSKNQEQIDASNDAVEDCFTTFGHRLPDLENAIKGSLHNPDAFEHVETVAIVPDAARNNVAMTFRAENGFGAVRTATVRAQLVPDGCVVQNVGKPEIN